MPEPSTELDSELDPKLIPIYYAAFHPYVLAVAMTALFAFLGRNSADPVGQALFGLFLSAPVWIACVVYVNRTYRKKVDVFNEDAGAIGRRIFGAAGEETAAFTIPYSHGSVRFVRPYRVSEPITVIVGESSILVYDDARLDLDRLSTTLGTSTREFFYDSIASVNYDDPYFEIKLSDGDQAQYRSSRKPDGILYELQNRVRQYKAAA